MDVGKKRSKSRIDFEGWVDLQIARSKAGRRAQLSKDVQFCIPPPDTQRVAWLRNLFESIGDGIRFLPPRREEMFVLGIDSEGAPSLKQAKKNSDNSNSKAEALIT